MPFAEKTAREFTEALASNAPVPGGGGAAALVGAIGTALAAMVSNLTTGKKKYAEYENDIQRIIGEAQALREKLLSQIDDDARCFEPLSRAYGIPKDDPTREQIMEDALRLACTAPLNIMKSAVQAIEMHAELAIKGSRLMLSDVGVGVLCCKTALMGASLSVFINLGSMTDKAYSKALRDETEALLNKYCPLADKIYADVFEKLS
ncbi:MAG: cyclodeaminase/cyclohydrolase family protein [Oscillospiraceae bacterium]